MKRFLLAFLLLVSGVSYAYSQSPVITQPYGSTTLNSSSTITVTNTFQSIWIASGGNTGRVGCTIQNNGTHNMYVYFGPIASATTTNSILISAGQSVNCNSGSVILKDQVSITGTANDVFYAAQQ